MGKAKRARPLDSRIGHRVHVTLASGERFTGRLLLVESKDGSVILADAERERLTKKKQVIRSQEGFIVVRGFNISSIEITDTASPIGWAGHRDSLVPLKASAGAAAASGSAAAGGTGGTTISTIDYAQMMRETGALQRKK